MRAARLAIGTITHLDRGFLPVGNPPDAVFTASVAWSPATRRVTVTLGARTCSPALTVSASDAEYAADGAIGNVTGVPIAATPAPAGSGRLF